MRHGLPTHRWRKSSHSNGGSGNCVETQLTDDFLVAVGDSKARALGAFTFTPDTWTSLLTTLKRNPR